MPYETYTQIEGEALRELVRDIRSEFLARPMYVDLRHELRQLNCVRVVALEVLEQRTPDEQLAVVADLLVHNVELPLLRPPTDVFAASDTPAACILDLVCEVAWQALMGDLTVRVEDEIRHALAAV